MDTLGVLKGSNVNECVLKLNFLLSKFGLCPDYDYCVKKYQIACYVSF